MKVYVDIIHGDKKVDQFMHACDVFEAFKVLGEHNSLEVEGDGIDLDNLCENIKNSYEKSGRIVSFVAIKRVGATYTNEYKNYIRPGTAAISTGHQWGMLHKILSGLGYKVETDSQMRVISAKFDVEE